MLDCLLVFHNLVEEGGKEGLCIADDAPCTREGRERRGALVAVQVDDEVEMLAANAADKAQKSERMIIRSLLVEQKTAVDMLVADDEIGELLVCEKRDARLREVRPKRPEDGRHEHEVADVHEVDDEDVVVVFLLHRMLPYDDWRQTKNSFSSAITVFTVPEPPESYLLLPRQRGSRGSRVPWDISSSSTPCRSAGSPWRFPAVRKGRCG